MAKLFVVCPNCQAKFVVADRSISGRGVRCQKCSQKFQAKVYVAKPRTTAQKTEAPPPADPFGSDDDDNDLLGNSPASNDLFADVPAAPALSSPAPAQPRKASSRVSIPIMSIALAGGGAFVVVAVVVGLISVASKLGSFSGGGNGPSIASSASNSDSNQKENLAIHRQVLEQETSLIFRFVDATESVNSEQDLPQFLTTSNSVITELKTLAAHVRQIPKPTEATNTILRAEANDEFSKAKPRIKSAGLRMAKYNQNPDVTRAMLGFYAALGEINAANSAPRATTNSPPATTAKAASEPSTVDTPGKKPRQKPAPIAADYPGAGPFTGPRVADMRPQIPEHYPTNKRRNVLEEFRSKYPPETLVSFRASEFSKDQITMIAEEMAPHVSEEGHVMSGLGQGRGAIMLLFYSGDINSLLPHVSFGEIERVDIPNRCIYLKSVKQP